MCPLVMDCCQTQAEIITESTLYSTVMYFRFHGSKRHECNGKPVSRIATTTLDCIALPSTAIVDWALKNYYHTFKPLYPSRRDQARTILVWLPLLRLGAALLNEPKKDLELMIMNVPRVRLCPLCPLCPAPRGAKCLMKLLPVLEL